MAFNTVGDHRVPATCEILAFWSPTLQSSLWSWLKELTSNSTPERGTLPLAGSTKCNLNSKQCCFSKSIYWAKATTQSEVLFLISDVDIKQFLCPQDSLHSTFKDCTIVLFLVFSWALSTKAPLLDSQLFCQELTTYLFNLLSHCYVYLKLQTNIVFVVGEPFFIPGERAVVQMSMSIILEQTLKG